MRLRRDIRAILLYMKMSSKFMNGMKILHHNKTASILTLIYIKFNKNTPKSIIIIAVIHVYSFKLNHLYRMLMNTESRGARRYRCKRVILTSMG